MTGREIEVLLKFFDKGTISRTQLVFFFKLQIFIPNSKEGKNVDVTRSKITSPYENRPILPNTVLKGRKNAFLHCQNNINMFSQTNYKCQGTCSLLDH